MRIADATIDEARRRDPSLTIEQAERCAVVFGAKLIINERTGTTDNLSTLLIKMERTLFKVAKATEQLRVKVDSLEDRLAQLESVCFSDS